MTVYISVSQTFITAPPLSLPRTLIKKKSMFNLSLFSLSTHPGDPGYSHRVSGGRGVRTAHLGSHWLISDLRAVWSIQNREHEMIWNLERAVTIELDRSLSSCNAGPCPDIWELAFCFVELILPNCFFLNVFYHCLFCYFLSTTERFLNHLFKNVSCVLSSAYKY